MDCNHAIVLRILNDELSLRCVCSVWVPHALTEVQRKLRVNCAHDLKRILIEMGEERYNRYVVQDETWVFWDSLRTKAENKTWIPLHAPRQQVVIPKLTRRKTLLMVAFTPNGRFSVTGLPCGITCDGEKRSTFCGERVICGEL